jgi:hypothetical protein
MPEFTLFLGYSVSVIESQALILYPTFRILSVHLR